MKEIEDFVKDEEDIKDPYMVKDIREESYEVSMKDVFPTQHQSEDYYVGIF